MALDTLQTFYEGPMLTLKAQQLDVFSRQHKFPFLSIYFLVNYPYFAPLYLIQSSPFAEMDAGRQRTTMRESTITRKQQGETSVLAPNVASSKMAPKRKSNVKDDRLSKKATGSSIWADYGD